MKLYYDDGTCTIYYGDCREIETQSSGTRYWSMWCDFNSIKPMGVAAAFEGFPDLRPVVRIGDLVMLRDGEGNSCEGRLVCINPGWNDNYATCYVQMDAGTWKSEDQP